MNSKTIIGGTLRSWVIISLTLLLLVSIAFVAVTYLKLAKGAKNDREWVSQATLVQVASQQLAKSASEAAAGNLEAFTELSATHSAISRAMIALIAGDPSTGTPAVPDRVLQDTSRLNATWNSVSENASSISAREELLLSVNEANSNFFAIVPKLQESADQSVRRLTESGASNQHVFAASRLLILSDRMLRRVNEILQGGSNAVSAAQSLESEMQLFQQVLSALLNGNQSLGITRVRNQQALASLGGVRSQFNQARPHLQAILDSSSDLFEVRGAADEIFLDSRDLYDQAGSLSGKIANLPRTVGWPSQRMGIIGLAIMLGIAVTLVGFVIAAERYRATVATSRNRHNQRAILKLLDELSSLADGDLTVHATVSNEMTGAIADAVNYAVEQLRELVMAINDTAVTVTESAQETRSSASKLADAAGHQAEQIDLATKSIQEMAQSFDAMSERSKESSSTAQRSVSMAHEGAEKVRESINGMDTIREQIQQTSKRIKRLGESSQEIGDIIGLINGIAEQTNVLALNAAIQAASAGGAGKGFAVVADEVQQLAESATNATKRIEGLVQTIQADTSEAVISMESTTSEVVRGTQLAEDAGTSLAQIDKVSKDLEKMIQDITREAHDHSKAATKLSGQMHDIREVSIRTSTGSKQAARDIENLAEQVQRLRETVADFKLPRKE